MTTRFDRIVFQAIAGGIDISERVVEASISFDLSRRISECTLKLTEWPTGVEFWDDLDIYCGLTSRTPSDAIDPATNGALHRFTGYVWDPSFDLFPSSRTMQGRGPLILAERQRVPFDEEMDIVSKSWGEQYFTAAGIDMSANPDTAATWRGQDMIEWVLTKSGLASKISTPLGGTAHVLGLTAFDQFVWRRQESALEFVEKIDKIGLGFRTYELPPCSAPSATRPIVRTCISMIPNVGGVKATFWEGRDLFAGASLTRSPSLIRNCVRVSGFNPGDYTFPAVEYGAHPVPPPGIVNPLDTESFESSLLEVDEPDGTYEGVSCREVARWLLEERRHDWWEITCSTWRDDAIGAGESVYVNSPRMIGNSTGQAWWVQSVTIRVGPGAKFRQDLKLRAPAYWSGPGSMLGNLQLGGAIN